jgi:hypothetical protein
VRALAGARDEHESGPDALGEQGRALLGQERDGLRWKARASQLVTDAATLLRAGRDREHTSLQVDPAPLEPEDLVTAQGRQEE